MKLAIGSDHAGFDAKEKLRDLLVKEGHDLLDAGTFNTDSCNYPEFAQKVAAAVCNDEVMMGILICGTGLGMSMAANKFKGIRAALCHNPETARLSREHNDANILCLGARVLDGEVLAETTKAWLSTPFEGGRHASRLDMIRKFEEG